MPSRTFRLLSRPGQEDGVCSLTVAPYQSLVLVTNPKSTVPMEAKAEKLCGSLALEKFDLVLKPVVGEAETIADFELKPVSNIRRDFSGKMTYTAKFTLDKVPARAAFAAQYVFECMELTVNGKALPRVYTPPYEQDITEALQPGENEIIVRVVSTALRDANTKPGIFGKERTILEPTGMFGTAGIKLYE